MLRKRWIFPLTVALFFSGNLFAAATQVTGPASVNVNVGRAHYQQIPDYASALGTLVAVRSTGLSFLSSGHLRQKLFQDGAKVKKGDVIAKLDDSTITALLASAKANMEEAQSNYNRYELLKDSGVFSKQDYISVSTTLKVAKAKYANVLEQEQQLSLVAPFSGTLGKYNYSIGTQVGVGTVIVNLVQLDPLKVDYSLSQSEKGRVSLGQKVLVHSDTWPNKKFIAKVSYISPTVNPNTGRFDIEAILSNPKEELSPGGLVHVQHILGKGHQALVVPQTAVNVDEDRSYVYVVQKGRAHQESVITGQPTDNGNIIIEDGLKEGDEAVISGVQKLSENMPVTVVENKSSEKSEDKKEALKPGSPTELQEQSKNTSAKQPSVSSIKDMRSAPPEHKSSVSAKPSASVVDAVKKKVSPAIQAAPVTPARSALNSSH